MVGTRVMNKLLLVVVLNLFNPCYAYDVHKLLNAKPPVSTRPNIALLLAGIHAYDLVDITTGVPTIYIHIPEGQSGTVLLEQKLRSLEKDMGVRP